MTLAKYIRLSSQDDDCRPGEKLESNSIANQRSLLDHYIASQADLAGCRVLEFLDDGHTGTNFDRPGVQAMFAAVKRGEVSCIVVKDLSRFGRTGSEVGEYLERIFPLLQVRFIAVNDGYDSNTRKYGAAGDLDVGVRNIMNELYSRKVSQDVKTAKRQCAARGECIAAYPFYGYVKSAENRRKLEVDPSAAEVVRMIFSLWLEGHPIEEIADTLNDRQIPSPSARKRELGAKRTSWSHLREDIPWTNQAVRVILRNEQYTGKLISLRTTRKELGNPDQQTVPKEDWIVVDNAFEAIIGKDIFQQAQTLFRTIPPKAPRRQTECIMPLFYRKIVCGVCGQGLMRQKARRTYYRCKEKRGPLAEQCKSIRVYEDDLTVYVLSKLKDRAVTFSDKAVQEGTVEESGRLQAQIASLEQQVEKQWSSKKDTFVKWNAGQISKAEYETVCTEKGLEIQRLNAEIKRLKDLLTGNQQLEGEYPNQLANAVDATELTREMVDALLQTVRVLNDGQVEVEWRAGCSFTKGSVL